MSIAEYGNTPINPIYIPDGQPKATMGIYLATYSKAPIVSTHAAKRAYVLHRLHQRLSLPSNAAHHLSLYGFNRVYA